MIRGFFKTLFRRQADRDLDAELRYHLDARADALIAQGLRPAEARRQARLEFGGIDDIAEQCRDSRPARWLHDLLQDLDYAGRMLRRSPIVSAAAIISLGLGIGANTAIFSLLDALLLKELPVTRPAELTVLNWQAKQRARLSERYDGSQHPPGVTGDSFSYAAFEALRHRPEFRHVAGFSSIRSLSVAAGGITHAVTGQLVTGDYHALLGVQPHLGRLLQPSDDSPAAPLAVVVSHRFWQNALRADPSFIGRSLRLNNRAATLVGVTPPGFFGHEVGASPDLTVSLLHLAEIDPHYVEGMAPFTDPTSWSIKILARLADPGANVQALEARLTPAFLGSLPSLPPNPAAVPHLLLEPAARGISGLRRGLDTAFAILFGSTGLVLLIACANVANLLLARAMGRQREIAVRLSLGASRGRIWRQFLSEFLLLAVLGAIASLVVAADAPAWLITVLPSGPSHDIILDYGLDWRLLLATSAVALAVTFLFGAIPAWRASRLHLTGALKENSGSLRAGTSRRRGQLSKLMIAGQVALSLILLAGAGMFVRTLINLKTADLGWASERLVLFTLNAAQVGYGDERRAPFYERITHALEAVPGVSSVSGTATRPLLGGGYWDDISSPRLNYNGRHRMVVGVHQALPHLATTMGVRLLAGRDLDERDHARSARVVVVNETVAREGFGNRNPVGETLHFGERNAIPYLIVGLVADARYDRIRRLTPTIYLPAAQQTIAPEELTFIVRTALAPSAVLPQIRAAVATIEPNIPLVQLRTLDQQVDESLRAERMYATLGAAFAALALVLSAIGIFGVMAYQAAQRRQEIGVRLALGARRHTVIRLVLGESLLMVGGGILLGLPAAYYLPTFVDTLLYGLKATDPAQFLIAIAVLLFTGLLAAWIPAWRASRLDPLVALREE